jgi:hypothetical protein
MESWRKTWREGFGPALSTIGLQALVRALQFDDERLIQGVTSEPQWRPSAPKVEAEAVCAVAFCGWQGEGLERVDEIEEFVAKSCFEADQRLGEPGASRRFLDWFDRTPREEMRRQLLGEVRATLAERVATKRVYQPAIAARAA